MQFPQGKPPVGIIFDSASGHVLVVSGRGKALFAFKPDIDPIRGKIGPPVALRGEPEFLSADEAGKVYINLMDTHEVAVVDLKARKVLARRSGFRCPASHKNVPMP